MSDESHRYVITGVLLREEPLVVYATDRLDATLKLGLTVWTEDEWKQAEESFKKMPKRQPCPRDFNMPRDVEVLPQRR